ncbi:DUF1127 domain-containing protein [Paucibacter sp. DJ2R-2]|uniref:DUF1127 domain-containing protein n=1 Tax=Paucibacter sp. DJ2R-2 TaxID=2893558 RepID=UPI0021E40DCD|nr:DUF1127 domain-containing protein [Paucibacter sp. DJ2R-2]MCV2422068.1 DUF1127 domain-containing protein [Paucibacter sp. DJ4R-1]MCV2439315.1 DUF1127 domain-containing protein [Paucibacter sp. DJ2R-2]
MSSKPFSLLPQTLLRMLKQSQQARRARAELREMDGRALNDLALGRGEVEAVLAGATIKADGAAPRPRPTRPTLPHGLTVLRAPDL